MISTVKNPPACLFGYWGMCISVMSSRISDHFRTLCNILEVNTTPGSRWLPPCTCNGTCLAKLEGLNSNSNLIPLAKPICQAVAPPCRVALQSLAKASRLIIDARPGAPHTTFSASSASSALCNSHSTPQRCAVHLSPHKYLFNVMRQLHRWISAVRASASQPHPTAAARLAIAAFSIRPGPSRAGPDVERLPAASNSDDLETFNQAGPTLLLCFNIWEQPESPLYSPL